MHPLAPTTACQATHCELVGDPPANGLATILSANNIFNGVERPYAVLTTLQVRGGSSAPMQS